MRELKFRAWYKPEKKMIYNIQNEFEERIELGMDCFSDYLKNDDFIVNQFTGRTDKEGKEIYEDDILLIIGQGYFRVTWDRDNCKFYLLPLEDYLDKMPLDRSWEIDYEVEGNIHENKDLLEYIEKDQKTK
nr:MAG TPA: YopX protein [Caudoviricetes sp.]DAY06731.1 MAG TPA: YopX protein [Caudoviricetes sp.]